MKSTLLTLVFALIFLLFGYDIHILTQACLPPDKLSDCISVSEFIPYSAFAINALLAANFGWLLGGWVTDPTVRYSLTMDSFSKRAEWDIPKAQVIAALFYLIVMAYLFIYWAGQPEPFTESAAVVHGSIPKLIYAFFGEMVIIFGMMIGIKNTE